MDLISVGELAALEGNKRSHSDVFRWATQRGSALIQVPVWYEKAFRIRPKSNAPHVNLTGRRSESWKVEGGCYLMLDKTSIASLERLGACKASLFNDLLDEEGKSVRPSRNSTFYQTAFFGGFEVFLDMQSISNYQGIGLSTEIEIVVSEVIFIRDELNLIGLGPDLIEDFSELENNDSISYPTDAECWDYVNEYCLKLESSSAFKVPDSIKIAFLTFTKYSLALKSGQRLSDFRSAIERDLARNWTLGNEVVTGLQAKDHAEKMVTLITHYYPDSNEETDVVVVN